MGLPALLLITVAVVSTHGLRYYGCSYAGDLCESEEVCEDDGLFGRCAQVSGGGGDYGAEEDETEEVKFLEGLQPDELRILRDQLAELVSQGGMRWETPLVQCTVAYFFLSHNHDLDYRPNFCKVREPLNVLAVVQLVEEGLDQAQSEAILENLLSSEGAVEERAPLVEPDYPDYAASLPETKRGGEEEAEANAALEELLSEAEREEMLQNILASITADLAAQEEEEKALAEEAAAEYADSVAEAGASGGDSGELELSPEEQETLDDLLLQVIQGEKPNLDGLSDDLLTKFILNIQLMRAILDGQSGGSGEAEEVVPLVAGESPSEEPRLILKKDTEEIGNLDMGLPAQHNIVKGAAPPSHNLHRIQGNTVYLRLNKDMEHNEGKVLDLMAYLEEAIARPKNLTFSNFNVDGGEISFQVSHSHSTDEPDPQWLASVFGLEAPAEQVESPRPMLPVSSVAEAVYKRRSDIAEVVGGGAEVRETGLGSGEERLAVEGKGADGGLVVLTLGVCGLVVGVLASLLSLYVYRNRSHAKAGIERLAHDLEGQPNKAYEELCRARMASAKAEGGGGSGGGSLSSPPANIAKGSSPRNSSTSSWSEEPVPTTNMDISTGHIILSYLEEHLHKKDRLAEEWAGLVSAAGAEGLDATIAALPQNKERNLFPAATPYDVVRVKLGTGDNDYINASPIYDSDPGSPVYIASQHPSEATAELFWEMVWEQGVVLILNLAASDDTGPDGTTPLHRYWPSSGSQLYGPFELHLVSEHIWCEDYVVRSFYLKNTRTTETRTVTQFHFLSWSKAKAPTNPKPLLEFRRKVKKSYRGRGGAPMVVHCSDGSGRTGTFCLLDTVLTRINKGVKEMNMAGTVEHLRDQRMGMCGDLDSYTFALSAVAAEVAAILQALPNHNNQH